MFKMGTIFGQLPLIYLDLELSRELASLPVISVIKSKEDSGNFKRISPKWMNNERCGLRLQKVSGTFFFSKISHVHNDGIQTSDE